jgi:lantibiotic modifying enzyme
MLLHDPARHEPLRDLPWNPERAGAAIGWIVSDTRARSAPTGSWPVHPSDLAPSDDPSEPVTPLYYGAAGVVWALRYLQEVGATPAAAQMHESLEPLRLRNRAWLAACGSADAHASYLMGDTPIRLMQHADDPQGPHADALAALIDGNRSNPALELMWGSPGTLLAASFLHQRTDEPRWADLYRATAAQLRGELQWSDEHGCHHWVQDLYGRRASYLDAVHGFVATAHGLIRGRHLLAAAEWASWQQVIAQTIARTATRVNGMASWRTELFERDFAAGKKLMQFCHGAPGFVICLADFPAGTELDALLVEAGEATWAAGPLAKGSNLCHGTAGNGYALLKLFERTGDARWLHRARAFAMHAIVQAEDDARQHGQLRYSLWTGDLGLAIYLWDCLRAKAAFPTLDVFDGRGEPSGP